MLLLGQILCVIAAMTSLVAVALNIFSFGFFLDGFDNEDGFPFLFFNGIPFTILIIVISLDRFLVFQERVDSNFSKQLMCDAKKSIEEARLEIEALQKRNSKNGQ